MVKVIGEYFTFSKVFFTIQYICILICGRAQVLSYWPFFSEVSQISSHIQSDVATLDVKRMVVRCWKQHSDVVQPQEHMEVIWSADGMVGNKYFESNGKHFVEIQVKSRNSSHIS
ncbi:hypothetical protein KIN20_010662 [Parelaphostrongylus tenuis]|uniref:Uncharacterized protein n=1 Tax=Parelaphostrongylus tenuis TaxID=148309 RepID=A0AAD5QIZ2_PARTN|nr:hypothetical protein KIN20_010662 [Parelaphostrongylus tenuis]